MAKKINKSHSELVSESLETTTEIEAPYELPDGWKWKLMPEVVIWGSGGTPKATEPKYYENGNIPWLIIADLNDSIVLNSASKITQEGLENSSAKLIPPNTLLVAMYGSIGKLGITGIECCTNQAIAFAKELKNVTTEYMFHYMASIKSQLIAMGRGGTQQNISQTLLNTLKVPLPPTLEEQKLIVARIETLFAKLDQAKEKAQTVVDNFETRKAAILHQAFTGQLTKKWRAENGVAEYSWEEKKLGDLCKLGSGGTPLKSHPEYYENGTIPWLNTGEIDWNNIEYVEKYITQEGVDNSSAKLYPADSVVIAMYGMGVTRGKAAILKIPSTTNQAVCVLQPNENLNNRFLFYYFMCNYWTFREQAVGGNQLNYSATMISKWILKLPTLPEQTEIVRILDNILEKENKSKEAAQTVLEQIDLLKKSILARAFRGEI